MRSLGHQIIAEFYDCNRDSLNDVDFIRSAIFSNNTWSIPWKYVGIPFEEQEACLNADEDSVVERVRKEKHFPISFIDK